MAKTNWQYNEIVKPEDMNAMGQEINEALQKARGAIPATEKGQANGVAKLDANGKVLDGSGNVIDGQVKTINGRKGDVTLNANDVGLGNVQNYGIASQAEAEQGSVNNKYMTPLRTKQLVDKFAETPAGAQAKADQAETNAKNYADSKATTAENNAKAYADTKAAQAETNAKNASLPKTGDTNVEISVKNAFNVSGYRTSNTGTSNANKWTRLCSLRVTSQYNYVIVDIDLLSGHDSSATAKFATVYVRLKQQNPMGQSPYCQLVIKTANGLSSNDIKGVVTANSATETILELWAKIPREYEEIHFYPKNLMINGGSFTPFELQAFSDTLPTGTQVDAVVVFETPSEAQAKVDAHAADNVRHITDAERTKWNNAQLKSFTDANGIPAIFGGDLNTLKTFGDYYISVSATNKPSGFNSGLCMVRHIVNKDNVYQFLIDFSSGVFIIRYWNGSSWNFVNTYETTSGAQAKADNAETRAKNYFMLAGIGVQAIWYDISLINGVQPYSSASRPRFCKIGNIVFLIGAVKNITGPITVGYLPEGYRPIVIDHVYVQNTSMLSTTQATFAHWEIGMGGAIRIVAVGGGATFQADKWFPIDTCFVAEI